MFSIFVKKASLGISVFVCTMLMTSSAEAVRKNAVWGTVPDKPVVKPKTQTILEPLKRFMNADASSVWGVSRTPDAQKHKVHNVTPKKYFNKDFFGFLRRKTRVKKTVVDVAVNAETPKVEKTPLDYLLQEPALERETPEEMNLPIDIRNPKAQAFETNSRVLNQ